MDAPRSSHRNRRGRHRAPARAFPVAAGLIVWAALPVAAFPLVVWPGFQGDASHSGYVADGPAPPYAEAWSAPVPLGGPSGQFGLAAPVIVEGTVVTVGFDAVWGVSLATGTPAWDLARDPGPSVPPAALVLGEKGVVAYTEGYGPYPPGSRASASASSTTSVGARASPTPNPAETSPVDSHVAAIDVSTQEPLWPPVQLDAVSSTGVTALDGVAYVGTQTGSVYAIDLRKGTVAWTADAGESVDAPLAVADGSVIATTRATDREPASVVALATTDGSETWRWSADTPASPRLTAAAVGDGQVFVGSADLRSLTGSLLAIDLRDGSLTWTARTNGAMNLASAPAVVGDAVYALDFHGQLYRFDAGSGFRLWDFALNDPVWRGSPVVIGGYVVVGATAGGLAVVEAASGDLVWQAADDVGQLRSFAIDRELIVAVRGGLGAGLVAYRSDPDGTLVRMASPTVVDPLALFGRFSLAALAFGAITILGGRWLLGRAGPALASDGDVRDRREDETTAGDPDGDPA